MDIRNHGFSGRAKLSAEDAMERDILLSSNGKGGVAKVKKVRMARRLNREGYLVADKGRIAIIIGNLAAQSENVDEPAERTAKRQEMIEKMSGWLTQREALKEIFGIDF
jgi:hypothetical protein